MSTSLKEIEDFLYQEADYLDSADLDSWLELFDEDGTYWMPVSADQPDPIDHISLFYDDRVIMEVRRRNLKHPNAPSKDLPIRSSHIIGSIRLQEKQHKALDCSVKSNFHCVVYNDNKQTLYAGTYQHDLVRVDGELKIHQKKVNLINCDAVLGAILIYI